MNALEFTGLIALAIITGILLNMAPWIYAIIVNKIRERKAKKIELKKSEKKGPQWKAIDVKEIVPKCPICYDALYKSIIDRYEQEKEIDAMMNYEELGKELFTQHHPEITKEEYDSMPFIEYQIRALSGDLKAAHKLYSRSIKKCKSDIDVQILSGKYIMASHKYQREHRDEIEYRNQMENREL